MMKHLILSLSIFLTLAACKSHHDPEPEPDTAERTVLVYMVDDTNLANGVWDENNIGQMEAVAADGKLNGGRLLVYRASTAHSPELFEVTATGRNTLKTYSNSPSSITVERMDEVFADMRELAPNTEYGLILWGHGTGWTEESNSRALADDLAVRPYSFGKYAGRTMKVTTLAKALNDEGFAFIYFDCCHMATMEVAYELRGATPAIIACATELPMEGMPYTTNIPAMFARTVDLTQVARNTYEYYMSEEASNNSCAIALIKTEALGDLAAATRAIVAKGPQLPDSYKPVPLYRLSGVSPIYDMSHYIHALTSDASALAAWDEAFSRAVPYHAATPVSYGLDMSEFHGLGSFIVKSLADVQDNGYYNYSWWSDVISHNPLLKL